MAASLAGLSQTDVAERAGVSQPRVAQWADASHEALPNLKHLLADGGVWAGAVVRLLREEIEAAAPLSTRSLGMEVARLLERTAPLFRLLGAVQQGDLLPEVAAQLAADVGAIAGHASRLQRSLLAVAKGSR